VPHRRQLPLRRFFGWWSRFLSKANSPLDKLSRPEILTTVQKLCQNPLVLGAIGLQLSEKQIPQVVGFIRKRLKQRELLERAAMRPRQVRYQAALRPDIISWIDSKVLSNFISTPALDFWPRPCTDRALIRSLHHDDRAHSVAGAISLARRLSFSKASRFICNFIWEYFWALIKRFRIHSTFSKNRRDGFRNRSCSNSCLSRSYGSVWTSG
jgi:hypothetical protein